MNYIDPSGHAKESSYLENMGELKVCTDGVIKNKYEKRYCGKKPGPYGDRSHQCGMKCFKNKISAEEILYIVVPTGWSQYLYSVGVIINRRTGNYLFGVVAEYGPKDAGLGEVSIYAAWKMKGWGIPSKSERVPKAKRIADSSVRIKKTTFRIIIYRKSTPKPKAKNSGYGWKYTNASKFRKQIKSVGKKFYKPGRGQKKGKCLN